MRLLSRGIRRVCAREFGLACIGIAQVDYEPLLIGDGFRAKTLAAKVLCTLCREAVPDGRSAHWKLGGCIGCSVAEG
jgi:hypothetical protein